MTLAKMKLTPTGRNGRRRSAANQLTQTPDAARASLTDPGAEPISAPRRTIVVIGGTGTIGSRLTAQLRASEANVIVASPSRGVDAYTNEGLSSAFSGADMVIDVSSPPRLQIEAALDYFCTAGLNIARAARAAGIRHHVVLSMVGADRPENMGIFRAKMVQERIAEWSGLPYTIVRSTPFFEYLDAILAFNGDLESVRMPSASTSPIAADDVALKLMGVLGGQPRQGVVEICGPDSYRLPDLAREILTANEDQRSVVEDAAALYFGALIGSQSLLPQPGASRGIIRLDDWLRMYVAEDLPPAN